MASAGKCALAAGTQTASINRNYSPYPVVRLTTESPTEANQVVGEVGIRSSATVTVHGAPDQAKSVFRGEVLEVLGQATQKAEIPRKACYEKSGRKQMTPKGLPSTSPVSREA